MEGMDEAKSEMHQIEAQENISSKIQINDLEMKLAEMHEMLLRFKNQHKEDV